MRRSKVFLVGVSVAGLAAACGSSSTASPADTTASAGRQLQGAFSTGVIAPVEGANGHIFGGNPGESCDYSKAGGYFDPSTKVVITDTATGATLASTTLGAGRVSTDLYSCEFRWTASVAPADSYTVTYGQVPETNSAGLPWASRGTYEFTAAELERDFWVATSNFDPRDVEYPVNP